MFTAKEDRIFFYGVDVGYFYNRRGAIWDDRWDVNLFFENLSVSTESGYKGRKDTILEYLNMEAGFKMLFPGRKAYQVRPSIMRFDRIGFVY